MSTEKNTEEVLAPEPGTTPENQNTEIPDTETEIIETEPAGTQDTETQHIETRNTEKQDAADTSVPAETMPVQEETETPVQDAYSYDKTFEKLYTEIMEHFRSFSPSEQVAANITEEHITEYLEGTREERLLAFKERREKRFLTALEILAALTAVVLIVWFLKDNPAILVNILYLIGGLGIFFIWKRPHDRD